MRSLKKIVVAAIFGAITFTLIPVFASTVSNSTASPLVRAAAEELSLPKAEAANGGYWKRKCGIVWLGYDRWGPTWTYSCWNVWVSTDGGGGGW